MKIEWTTIESGKNKTNSKINTILENKNKFSVFLAENKKHLFWAWISTMAMAFVVWFANISWTQFSADLMFPSLSSEIQNTNSEQWKISDKTDSAWDISLWDLDLTFDDSKTWTWESKMLEVLGEEKSKEKSSSWNKIKSEKVSPKTDDTEALIGDLFWTWETSDSSLLSDKKVESEQIKSETKTLSLIQDTEKNKEKSKTESKSESKNISKFLEDNSWKNNEDLHWSALTEKNKVSEKAFNKVEEKSNNKNIFKQNSHTVDMNLVAYKDSLKEEKKEESLHWSAESFINSDEVAWFWSWVWHWESIWWNVQNNTLKTEYAVQKTKRLSQSWPWDMIFWLWFLSMILAFFLRRRRRRKI